MSEKIIAVRQADGSYYPIMKEGELGTKNLQLTTVKDDQTTVKVNLYKMTENSDEEPKYMDTLLIENLNTHPQGEATLNLDLSLDENNMVSAQVKDEETGAASNTKVSLVTLAENTLDDISDFTIDNDDDQDPDEVYLGDVSPTVFETPETEASIAETENLISSADTDSDDNLFTADTNLDNLPSFDKEDTNSDDSLADFDTSELEDLPSFDDTDLNDTSLDDISTSDDTPLDDISTSDDASLDETSSFDNIEEESHTLTDEELSNLPSFDENSTTEDSITDFDTSALDDIPDFNDSILAEPPKEEELPNFDFSDDDASIEDPTISTDKTDPTFDNLQFPDGTSALTEYFDEKTDKKADKKLQKQEERARKDQEKQEKKALKEQKKNTNRKVPIAIIICIICAILAIIAVIYIFMISPLPPKTTKIAESETIVTTKAPIEPEKIELDNSLQEEAVTTENKIEIVQEDTVPEPVTTDSAPVTNDIEYLLRWGDTLWDLSDTYYRNPWLYNIIADYNNIKNPDLIIAGTYLNIPER